MKDTGHSDLVNLLYTSSHGSSISKAQSKGLSNGSGKVVLVNCFKPVQMMARCSPLG